AEAIRGAHGEANPTAKAPDRERARLRWRVCVAGIREHQIAFPEHHRPLEDLVARLEMEPWRRRRHVLQRAHVTHRAETALHDDSVCTGWSWRRLVVVRRGLVPARVR